MSTSLQLREPLTRRQPRHDAPRWNGPPHSGRRGPVVLDARERSISIHGVSAQLTISQYRLMMALLARAPGTLTHAELVDYLWGDRADGGPTNASGSTNQHLFALRVVLAALPGTIAIANVRALGFRLVGIHDGTDH